MRPIFSVSQACRQDRSSSCTFTLVSDQPDADIRAWLFKLQSDEHSAPMLQHAACAVLCPIWQSSLKATPPAKHSQADTCLWCAGCSGGSDGVERPSVPAAGHCSNQHVSVLKAVHGAPWLQLHRPGMQASCWWRLIPLEMLQKAISSDKSLQQGRNRSRELNFSCNKPILASSGMAHCLHSGCRHRWCRHVVAGSGCRLQHRRPAFQDW